MTEYAEAFWTRVLALAEDLDAMSYYHLLDVAPDAATATIEAAYYRRAKSLHPDRHTYQRDPRRMRALVRLYARLGEAFRVLRVPPVRAAYDRGLADGNMRLAREAIDEQRVEASAPDPRTEAASKLLETARTLARQGNLAGARAQLRLAAQFEPDSRVLAAELAALGSE